MRISRHIQGTYTCQKNTVTFCSTEIPRQELEIGVKISFFFRILLTALQYSVLTAVIRVKQKPEHHCFNKCYLKHSQYQQSTHKSDIIERSVTFLLADHPPPPILPPHNTALSRRRSENKHPPTTTPHLPRTTLPPPQIELLSSLYSCILYYNLYLLCFILFYLTPSVLIRFVKLCVCRDLYTTRARMHIASP